MSHATHMNPASAFDESLEELYENAPCGYLSVAPDGHIVKVNQTFLAWTGHSRQDLLRDTRFADLLTAGGRIYYQTHFLPSLDLHGEIREVALDLSCQRGQVLPVLVTAIQKRDGSGVPLFCRITVFNLAGRRAYEKELLLARQRAENDAVESRRHAGFLAQFKAAIIETDITGRITAWNTFAAKLLGYNPTEAIGKPISFILFPGEADPLDAWTNVRTAPQGFLEVELRVQTRTGEERFIRVALSLLKDDSAEPYAVIGLAVDITAQKEQEKALRESEARYRVLTEAMPQVAYVSDTDGKTQMVNARWQEYAGVTAAQCLGLNWLAFVHPEDVTGVMARWAKCTATGESYEGEYRLLNKDGEYRWHLARAIAVRRQDGTVVNWVGTFTDIHDRKSHEDALREKEEFLRTIFENSPDCLKVLDTDGRLIEMNSTGRCLMEIDDFDALRGYNWANFWGDDAAKAVEALERAKAGQVGRFQATCLTLSGKPMQWDVKASAVKDSSGRLLRFVVTSRDITVERQRKAALRASEASLKQHAAELARANADLLHFAYAVSHDLQAPLRTVTAFAQILDLTCRPALTDEGSELITAIVAASSRMGIMLRDLLEFAKVAGSEMAARAEVLLEEALEAALQVLGGSIQESKAKITHDPLPVVHGEAGQLAQVFQNLIGNSIKYRKPDTTPVIHITSERKGAEWLVTVQDNGTGFNPAYAERIFGVFQRLHSAEFAGTGIGLTICKRIVERHGGLIWAESTEGEGSKFSFSIPADGTGTLIRSAAAPAVAAISSPLVPQRPIEQTALGEIFLTLDMAQAFIRDMQGKILAWTGGAERLFGFSQGEALGREAAELLRKQFPKPWAEIEAALLRSGEWSGEIRATGKDGSVIWLASHLSLHRDGSGRPQSIVEVHNGINELKEAEAALLRSRQALESSSALAATRLAEIETLYTYAPVGLVLFDKDLRFVKINEHLAWINGIPAADHIGRTLAEVIPELAFALEPQLRGVIETRQPIIEEEVHGSTSGSPEGGSTWLHSYYPFLSADGSVVGLHGVVQDITARKATEQVWLESAERLQIATSAAELGVFFWDVPNDRLYGENQRAFELFGRSRSEGPLSSEEFFANVIHPDDAEIVAGFIKEVLAGKRVKSEACRIRRADGAARWIQFHGTPDPGPDGLPVSVIGVVADVTDQVGAQKVLLEERRHFSTLLNSVNAFIGVLSPEGILVEANRAPLEAAGIQAEEFIGKYLPDTTWWSWSTEVRAQIEAAIRKAQAGESSRFDVKARMQDGSLMTFDWAISPLRDEHGVIQYLVPSAVPIEDRKRIESLLATQKEVLELATQDAPLGEILRVIARAAQQQSGENSGAGIFLLEPDGLHLRAAAAEGFSKAYTDAVDHFEAGPDSRSCGIAVHTGETVIVGDVTKDPLWQPFLSLAKEHDIAAVWSQPLRKAGGKVFGTLALYHRTPREPEPGELEAIRLLGQTTALVIERNQELKQRRRAEEAVRESAKRWELMLDSIDQLAWTARADGFIFWYNRRWYEYTGTTAEQMEGWGWQVVHDPEKLPAVMKRWTASIGAGEPFDMEFPLRGADGVFRAFLTRVQPLRDSRGNVVQWFGTNTNIEALGQARDAVAESERRFRELAETLPELLWEANPEGQGVYRNPQCYSYTGLSPAEGHGDRWAQTVHPESAPAHYKKWQDAIQTGEPFETESLLRRHDGVYRWFLNRAKAVRDNEGRIVRWIGTSTDIHAQKLTEQALRRSNADLDQFAYAADHDLQEPLRMVTIYTQLLEETYGNKGEEAARFTKYIVNGTRRMELLLKGVLEYSRAGNSSDSIGIVDSEAIVQNVLKSLESEIAESGATITLGVLPQVRFPENQLSRIMQNLIGNALRYRAKRPLQIEISAAREGGGHEFRIADNGIGIRTEYLEQIFGVFKRLHKDEYPGVGIGLAVCKKLVERHGGRIWAESGTDLGSTFCFTIPVQEAG